MVVHMKVVEEVLQVHKDYESRVEIMVIVINLHLQYIPCLKEK